MNTTDILVIDDPAVCQIVQRMLVDEQCTVHTRQSVADALQAIEEKAFRPAGLPGGVRRTLLDSILEAPGIMTLIAWETPHSAQSGLKTREMYTCGNGRGNCRI